jgi:plastocyanin
MIMRTMGQKRRGWDFVGISLAVGVCLAFLAPAFSLFAANPFAVEVPLGDDGIQRATVEVDSYSFSPSHLIVRAGKPVELTFKSLTTFVPHNIVIDDPRSGLSIREEVPAGERMTIKFTPTVPGSFALYCDKKLLFFKSHREKGMEGVLEVR